MYILVAYIDMYYVTLNSELYGKVRIGIKIGRQSRIEIEFSLEPRPLYILSEDFSRKLLSNEMVSCVPESLHKIGRRVG